MRGGVTFFIFICHSDPWCRIRYGNNSGCNVTYSNLCRRKLCLEWNNMIWNLIFEENNGDTSNVIMNFFMSNSEEKKKLLRNMGVELYYAEHENVFFCFLISLCFCNNIIMINYIIIINIMRV